jgi:membrane protein
MTADTVPAVPAAPPDDRTGGFVERTKASLTQRWRRYEKLPLVDFGMHIYRRDRQISGTVVGSAIAFRLFLFFVPLLLFLVGVAGFISNSVDADEFNEEARLTGSLAAQIEAALSQPTQTRWFAVLIGLFGIGTTGYSLSKVMVASSALGWQLPDRPKASPKVIGAFVGLIAGIGLVAIVINWIRAELGLGVASISFLAAFCIYVIAWLIVSMVLPKATTDPGALLPGAAIVALTLTGMQAVSQLLIPGRVSRASALYGTFGATIVTLGWFFILGRAIVLGIVCNAVIYERFGRITNFVFSLPLIRVLRRSKLVRRVFRLEEVTPKADGDG